MDAAQEIRGFLTSRRERLTPERVGLPDFGPRRVKGLRREEVAVLAGVSVPYYVRMERGDLSGVSESVLEALARALLLDDAERAHLLDLARSAQPAVVRPQRARPKPKVRPAVDEVLQAITGAGAVLLNQRHDLLAANPLGRAIFSELDFTARTPPNGARFVFLDPRAPGTYPRWEAVAAEVVAGLRSAAGHDPHDRELSDLVGELATRSDAFRTLWAAHDVRFHANGIKTLHHPVVGDLELHYESLAVSADDGLTILTYTGADDHTRESLRLLASWTLTPTAPGPAVQGGRDGG